MRFRFIDRVVSINPYKSILAQKCSTFEEAMLARPGLRRGVPKTLLLEWVGQVMAILVAESTEYRFLSVLGSVSRLSFDTVLLAGDRVDISIQVRSWHDDSAYIDATILKEQNKIACIERAVFAFVSLPTLCDEDELRAAVRAAQGYFPSSAGFR